jgi:hypothetical protein
VTQPADDTHECPRNGCTRPVPPYQLMCTADWSTVPKAFQRAVWTAWRQSQGNGSPAHTAAIRAAINAVNGR